MDLKGTFLADGSHDCNAYYGLAGHCQVVVLIHLVL